MKASGGLNKELKKMSSVTKTIDYAPAEAALLDLLKKHQELDTHQLTDLFYRDAEQRPFNAEIVVGGTLRRLMKKMAINRENFRLKRTKTGNNPAVFQFIRGR